MNISQNVKSLLLSLVAIFILLIVYPATLDCLSFCSIANTPQLTNSYWEVYIATDGKLVSKSLGKFMPTDDNPSKFKFINFLVNPVSAEEGISCSVVERNTGNKNFIFLKFISASDSTNVMQGNQLYSGKRYPWLKLLRGELLSMFNRNSTDDIKSNFELDGHTVEMHLYRHPETNPFDFYRKEINPKTEYQNLVDLEKASQYCESFFGEAAPKS